MAWPSLKVTLKIADLGFGNSNFHLNLGKEVLKIWKSLSYIEIGIEFVLFTKKIGNNPSNVRVI